jgi:hypothetical protein
VIEEVRPLGAEAKEVPMRSKNLIRLPFQGASKRLFGEEEVGEVGQYVLRIA